MIFLFVLSSFSFKNNSLPATIPEFHCGCFLRSRCSMAMWCPDNTIHFPGVGVGSSRRKRNVAKENGASPDWIVVACRLLTRWDVYVHESPRCPTPLRTNFLCLTRVPLQNHPCAPSTRHNKQIQPPIHLKAATATAAILSSG